MLLLIVQNVVVVSEAHKAIYQLANRKQPLALALKQEQYLVFTDYVRLKWNVAKKKVAYIFNPRNELFFPSVKLLSNITDLQLY